MHGEATASAVRRPTDAKNGTGREADALGAGKWENTMASAGTPNRAERSASPVPMLSQYQTPDAGLCAPPFPQCVFCGEPLRFTATGVKAWRVDRRFFCNEFCADSAAN